jgi:hypothetical protein
MLVNQAMQWQRFFLLQAISVVGQKSPNVNLGPTIMDT